jgi:hypothetical protein
MKPLASWTVIDREARFFGARQVVWRHPVIGWPPTARDGEQTRNGTGRTTASARARSVA